MRTSRMARPAGILQEEILGEAKDKDVPLFGSAGLSGQMHQVIRKKTDHAGTVIGQPIGYRDPNAHARRK